jgi:hypothetical protein
MDEEKLSAEDERRLLALFEQSSLNDYPNPDRVGCPGPEFLRKLATDRKSIPLRHPALTHVSQCSPCFREFRDLRETADRRKKRNRAAAIAGAIVLAVGLGAYFTIGGGEFFHAHERRVEVATNLDLTNLLVLRGGSPSETAGAEATRQLPCVLQDVKVKLPLASEPGTYEIAVFAKDKTKPLASAFGEAKTVKGVTSVSVKLDLSALSPGTYSIAFRRTDPDWVSGPIRLVQQ